ncbi:hypothetical protein [Methylobacter sp.]|uniref:hypothetical protein n=1 Tax=Methylobacter sp. TaxID=2051955 RepID=UPI0024889E96|nr:hypothetical protein [Methylobacter sp.]MDI1277753.1 hypothetical protein [Methylobacter sp.]MDI1358345.1 hypothetical protein [Methylobacter sp.]
MSTLATTKKLKWLFSLVLIFGGFTIYKLFGVFAVDLANKEYGWVFEIISEFGLFLSVIISVGYFHHWLSAAEEHEESLRSLREALVEYVDTILLNSVKRGFSGITNKEFDFSQVMHGLKPGDYVYWLITFDPRFKNKSRELENAIKNGVHFRILILKADCIFGELRATETAGFNPHEFNEYSKLFKVSLEDVISHIDETIKGSLGVFVYEGLPSIPLFIIISNESKKVKVYNSFYLTEPVSKMPYLNWESELKFGNQPSFESEHWNLADLFLDYFKKRWEMEKEKNHDIAGKEHVESGDFIYAPASAKQICSNLIQD